MVFWASGQLSSCYSPFQEVESRMAIQAKALARYEALVVLEGIQ